MRFFLLFRQNDKRASETMLLTLQTTISPLQGMIHEKYFLTGYLHRDRNLHSKFHVSSSGSFGSAFINQSVSPFIYRLANMPGEGCQAIQRNTYFVVYPANNYLLKCYGIHDFFSVLRKNDSFCGISHSRKCKHIIFHMQIMDFQELVDTFEATDLVLS